MALALALIVIAAKGYAPFPNFWNGLPTLPILQTQANNTVFPQDIFVREINWPYPLLSILYSMIGSSEALPLILFALNFLTVFLAVLVIAGLLKTQNTSASLLPFTVLLAMCGENTGLGWGNFWNLSGEFFSTQALALLFYLGAIWIYTRGAFRHLWAALTLTLLADPAIGLQALIVLTAAALFDPRKTKKRTVFNGIAALVLSLPATLPFLRGMLETAPDNAAELILLRYAHFYEIKTLPLILYSLTVLAGWTALSLKKNASPLPLIMGAQTLLTGLCLLVFAPWVSQTTLNAYPVWLFQLEPLHTTPILLILSAIMITGALPQLLNKEILNQNLTTKALSVILIIEILTLLALQPPYGITLIILTLMGISWFGLHYTVAEDKTVLTLWIFIAITANLYVYKNTYIQMPPEPEKQQLFDWVKNNAEIEELFIIPPDMDGFRYYTKHSVYVNFSLFPLHSPSKIRTWKDRIDETAQPDTIPHPTFAKGWGRAQDWNRTYALHNTPERIETLLENTGAAYLILDRKALDMPPFVDMKNEAPSNLSKPYENEQFTIYTRKKPQ